MAIKKTDPCSSIPQSCDKLRDGKDPRTFRDCGLFLRFVKCLSDKYGDACEYPRTYFAGETPKGFQP